ncbi:MAG: DotU/TssL family secretion system protein [Iodobacter sp.]
MSALNRVIPGEMQFQSFFRDTLLLAASLRSGAQPERVEDFKARCNALIHALKEDLASCTSFSEQEVLEVIYAQCTFLDETALQRLREEDKALWQQNPLQVIHFGSYDGGEVVCSRVQALLQEKTPAPHMLVCYHVIFSLGFQGRYLLRPVQERELLMRELAQAIPPCNNDLPLIFDSARPSLWSRWLRFSPAGFMTGALLLTIAVYGVLDWSLQAATRLWTN